MPQRHITEERWRFLDATFSNSAWYRRWRGGHWERWYLSDPVWGFVWIPVVGGCSKTNGRRPPLGRYIERCEG